MKYKTLDDFDFKGKRVLLRVDLNSEVIDGKVILSDRIIEHAKTILELQKEGARVIILAHQGRPGEEDFIDLRQHARFLNEYVKIKFVRDIIGENAVAAIHSLKDGEALLLDNIRFLKDEFKGSVNTKMVRTLAALSDIYINDAFSIVHRKQTSIVSFPRVLECGIGRVMEEELSNLDKVKSKNCLYILGGSKVKDVLLLVKNDVVLVGGTLAPLCLIAQGYELGEENEILKKDIKEIKKFKKELLRIPKPLDLAVSIGGRRKEVFISEFPLPYQVLDIGTRTIEMYKKEINKASAIFVKGTMGYSEDEAFSKGTREILKAVAASKAFSVISGGNTTTALRKFHIPKKSFNYISLSGGALVHYMAGEKLPGLEVLEKRGKS